MTQINYTNYMQTDPTHHIDRHILKVLTYHKTARYRDLRPEHTDSNLFNYHRKILLQQNYIVQNADKTYSLGLKGMRLAERATFDDLRVRERPKLSIVFLIQNERGELAVWDKVVQPYINTVNLPNGKMRLTDTDLQAAAERMLQELGPGVDTALQLCGVASVYVGSGEEVITNTINMIARVTANASGVTHKNIFWVAEAELPALDTTPGVSEICRDFLRTKDFTYKNYVLAL